MLLYLYVGLGGALGSIARFWVSGLVAENSPAAFPFGTLIVNITGSFLIGLFAGLAGPEGRFIASPAARAFFMIGVCGGYTTFSSFSLQTLALLSDGEALRAGANVLLSVNLCLLAVWLGSLLASIVTRA